MNKTKKILSVLLCACMVISLCVMPVAATGTNAAVTANSSTVTVGETIEITITNALMNVTGFGCYLEIENTNAVECQETLGTDGDEYFGLYKTSGKQKWTDALVGDTAAEVNSDGIFSFGCAVKDETEFAAGTVATLKFLAKSAGTVKFTLTEDTVGTNAFKGVAGEVTVTINPAPCTVHDFKEDAELRYPVPGGEATCTSKATYYKACSECGAKGTDTFEYGELAEHNFTKQDTADKYKVEGTGANCQDKVEYYFACTACGEKGNDTWVSESVGAHSFTKKIADADHLVPGTGVNCQSAKEYYYDCAYCDEIGTTDTWTSSEFGDHVLSDWKQENDKHFRECTVDNCDHTTAPEPCSGTPATCLAKSVCATCGFEYGELAAHVLGDAYVSMGAEGHAHKCQTPNCTAHDDIVPHVDNNEDKICDVETCKYDSNCKHSGTINHYGANAATCVAGGNIEYWECDECKVKFSDAGKTTVVEIVTLPVDANAHGTKTVHPAVASTCTVQGNYQYETCNLCDKVTSGSDAKLALDPHNHNVALTKHTGTPANCMEPGIKDTYSCAACGVTFIDAAGTEAMNDSNKVIPVDKNNHKGSTGMQYDQNNHWGQCACGAHLKEEPHKVGTAATCKVQAVCSVCQQLYGELDPNNHVNVTKVETTPATKEAEGVMTVTCNDCGTSWTEAIPKLPSAVITPVGPSKDKDEENGEVELTMSFADVTAADWFYDTIKYTYENGLMNGVSEDNFAPYANTSRAMLVTILWRLEGEPAPLGNCQFVDVPAGAWYTEAVTWAAEKGIVTGLTATEFGPDANITREQFATILYRYAKNYKGYDVSVGEDTNILSYTDAMTVSEYAIPAMQWACGAGLINGIDGALQPAGFANRAQAATILARFCQNYQ